MRTDHEREKPVRCKYCGKPIPASGFALAILHAECIEKAGGPDDR